MNRVLHRSVSIPAPIARAIGVGGKWTSFPEDVRKYMQTIYTDVRNMHADMVNWMKAKWGVDLPPISSGAKIVLGDYVGSATKKAEFKEDLSFAENWLNYANDVRAYKEYVDDSSLLLPGATYQAWEQIEKYEDDNRQWDSFMKARGVHRTAPLTPTEDETDAKRSSFPWGWLAVGAAGVAVWYFWPTIAGAVGGAALATRRAA